MDDPLDRDPTVIAPLQPEAKRLWVEALRSGDYQQGTGLLHYEDEDGDQYCCLGVLCEVAISAGVEVERVRRSNGTYGYDANTLVPPPRVTEWAYGEAEPLGAWAVIVEEHRRLFDQLNDDLGYTFRAIADLIEQQL
jgi:hypothetical protein